MNRFGKFIGWLFFFALQAAFDTFVIWGLVTYGQVDTFVSDKTTIILLAVPTLLAVNLLLMIPAMIFGSGVVKKEKEQKFPMKDRMSGWFKGESKEADFKEEDIEKWFKENITEEKISQWFKDKFNES